MRHEVEVGVVPGRVHGPRDGPQAGAQAPTLRVRRPYPRSPPPGRHPDRARARRDDREGPGVRVLPDQRLRRVHERAQGRRRRPAPPRAVARSAARSPGPRTASERARSTRRPAPWFWKTRTDRAPRRAASALKRSRASVTSSPAAAGERWRGPRCGPKCRDAQRSTRRAPRGGRPRRCRRARGRWETRRARAPSTRRRSSPWPGPRWALVARAERAPRVDGGPARVATDCRRASRAVVARLLRESRVRRHVEHDLVRRGVAAQFEAARRVAFALGRRQRLRIACSAVMLSNCTASIEHC